MDCFARCFVKSRTDAQADGRFITHTEAGELFSLPAHVEKNVFTQKLVLAQKFPDVEMLLCPLAPMAGGIANSLVLHFAVIQCDNTEDLIKDQWYGVQQ